MKNEPYNFYADNVSKLSSAIGKIKKNNIYFYILRLILFLTFILFLILFFQLKTNNWMLALAGASLILFLFVIKLDLKYLRRKEFLKNKLLINQEELKMLKHDYHHRNEGDEYKRFNLQLATDFDLFGKGSLFQYLNRSATKPGEKKLAEGLSRANFDEDLIQQKQSAIKELSGKMEFVQNFLSHGESINEKGDEIKNLISWLNEPEGKQRLLMLTAIVIPVLNIALITLIIFNLLPVNSLVLMIMMSFGVLILNKERLKNAHLKLGKTASTFSKFANLIQQIEEEKFEAEHLRSLSKQLSGDLKASQSMTALFKLLNSFDLKYNIIVYFLLNSIFVFDIQIFLQLEKWKQKHKNIIPLWFESLTEFDVLLSYAVFMYNNQSELSLPQISKNDFIISAREMGHPLIQPETRINNPFIQKGLPSVTIITGANMAGKSTFLRTVVVNLILAMNGAPVVAKEFFFTPCHIMSSIKIQDSLSNNESYFYAELKRLKEIINHVQKHPKTLVILDELLRGTNTKDKQQGSLGLIEKLIGYRSSVMVATHDLSIGKMEITYPDIVSNFCFEVELINDKLDFDYKLKPGISQKLNASFLLRKMEIIK